MTEQRTTSHNLERKQQGRLRGAVSCTCSPQCTEFEYIALVSSLSYYMVPCFRMHSTCCLHLRAPMLYLRMHRDCPTHGHVACLMVFVLCFRRCASYTMRILAFRGRPAHGHSSCLQRWWLTFVSGVAHRTQCGSLLSGTALLVSMLTVCSAGTRPLCQARPLKAQGLPYSWARCLLGSGCPLFQVVRIVHNAAPRSHGPPYSWAYFLSAVLMVDLCLRWSASFTMRLLAL